MKILYYFQELDTPMFQWQRVHIIDELLRHNILVETFNPLLFDSVEQATEILLAKIEESNYDLFLSSVCYEKMISLEVLAKAHEKGLPTLCIRWDNLVIPFVDKERAKDFDLVWLTAKETAHLYRKWGANILVQPYAANPYTFTYQKADLNRHVCFIGTPYGSRSIMINELTSHGVDVDLYYGGKKNNVIKKPSFTVKYNIINPSRARVLFERLKFEQGRKVLLGVLYNKLSGSVKVDETECLHHYSAIHPEEISKHYSKYALCLSSTSTNHTDRLKNPLKIVNLRAFEIPMSGGIQICRFNEELSEYFQEGKEIVFYRTDEELVEKASYYTQKISDQEVYKMKEAARLRAENEHTWWCRFKKAFDILGVKYETE